MREQDTPGLEPGISIDGAVVEEWVGSGGQGSVYRARDKRTGTLLAFKFLPLSPWAQRESHVALPFDHPNLVRQMGCGSWPPLRPRFLWLKQVYVQGRDLDVWSWEDNPDALAVAGKMLGVSRALTVVHGGGVCHRDVKEANILVRDHDGEPVLVDFGAARHEAHPTLTQGMFPPGTPLYRSPEAWRFALEHAHPLEAHYRAGPADDLYALGVVLYRLLTGRSPFEVLRGDEASVKAVISQPPVPPHVVNPRVPEALSRVCLKLLEKTPEARDPNALALHEALRERMAGADDSWRVPLREGPRVPRRGRKAGAARRRPMPPLRPLTRRTSRMLRVAVGVTVVGGLVGGGAWLMERRESAHTAPSVTSYAPSPALQSLLGQEVARVWPPLEAARTGTGHTGEPPARVAERTTQQEEDTVKKQQTPQGLSRLARWCVGAAAATQAACPSATVRPSEPPKRSVPEAEACPEGALKTMETLGIIVNELRSIHLRPDHLEDVQHRPMLVREGPFSVMVLGKWGRLASGSLLRGRLLFGEGRVYGRFTEVQTPTGETFKVCMEMSQEGKRGAEMEVTRGSTPDHVLIFSSQEARSVGRFE